MKQNGVGFGILKPGNSAELNCTAHSDEEGQLVNLHDVHAEDDMTVLCHNGDGDRDKATGPDLGRRCPDCLAF